MATKKNSLGKGLTSIYGDDLIDVINELENQGPANQIALAKVRPNPYQPRKVFDQESLQELADSIKSHGLFTPILVRPALSGYELIAGERRLRAAKLAGLNDIPAIIVEFDDQQMMEVSLLENIQRADLNIMEEASGYQRLLESFNYTQEALAERLHKSRTHITNTLRLLRLPAAVQKLVSEGKLTAGVVRPLLALEDTKEIERLAKVIVTENLSARQVEALVKNRGKKVNKSSTHRKDYQLAEELLMTKLQTSVSVTNKKITIKFRDTADLNRILELLDCIVD